MKTQSQQNKTNVLNEIKKLDRQGKYTEALELYNIHFKGVK